MCCFKNVSLNNNKGQSLIEGFIVTVVITVIMFAAIQLCIIVVDDMYANYAAFFTVRKVVVTKNSDISDTAKRTVSKFFTPYMLKSKSVVNHKTTHWAETILGNMTPDHGGREIKKHNIKIAYQTKVMFYGLFNLQSSLREESARARMVKSPDEEFYNKAYPEAREFKRYG